MIIPKRKRTIYELLIRKYNKRNKKKGKRKYFKIITEQNTEKRY
jgi:hypothetical protein